MSLMASMEWMDRQACSSLLTRMRLEPRVPRTLLSFFLFFFSYPAFQRFDWERDSPCPPCSELLWRSSSGKQNMQATSRACVNCPRSWSSFSQAVSNVAPELAVALAPHCA